MTIRHVLVPMEVHDICTLTELLNWVAFKALPVGHDYNLEDDIFDNHRSMFPDGLEMGQQSEVHSSGLLPYPDYPDYPAPNILPHMPEVSGDFRQKSIEAHEKYEDKLRAWQESHDSLAEPAKASIFLALKNGSLPARGRLARTLFKTAKQDMWKDESGDSWEELEEPSKSVEVSVRRRYGEDRMEDEMARIRTKFEWRMADIPAGYWRMEGIQWEVSQSRAPGGWYEDIYFKMEDVFRCFPAPAKMPLQLQICAGFILPPDGDAVGGGENPSKRGRPAGFDWHAFDVEVARVIKAGRLPKKQEAFISTMQEWCLSQWGKTPQRTTLIQRVSPFYKMQDV